MLSITSGTSLISLNYYLNHFGIKTFVIENEDMGTRYGNIMYWSTENIWNKERSFEEKKKPQE
jgi:hypothetical protein